MSRPGWSCAILLLALQTASMAAQPGEEVDLAPFGHAKTWDGNRGVEWDEPRDVRRVEVDFADAARIPDAASLQVEYWVRSWPPKFQGGWTNTESPWQGKWYAVDASREVQGKIVSFHFRPLSVAENPNAANVPGYTPSFRRTLKIRLRFSGEAAALSALRIYGNSRWNVRELNLQTGCEGKPRLVVSTTAYNGEIQSTEAFEGNPPGVRLKILYSEHEPSSNDQTILTVRAGEQAFGVRVDDVIQRKGVYVRPLGIFVGDGAAGESFESWVESGAMREGEDIISRTTREGEQSLERATAEIPPLSFTRRQSSHQLRYIPLGFPASREKYGLDFNGSVFINKHGVKAMKEDLARMLWEGPEIYFRVATGNPPDFREREGSARQRLLEDYLPLVTTRWSGEGIDYEEEAYATMLDAPLDDARLRGDEPSLLHLKLQAKNLSARDAESWVWFAISPAEKWELRNGMVLGISDEHGTYPLPRLRAVVQPAAGLLEQHELPASAAYSGKAILWKVPLAPGATAALEIKIPFRTLESAADQERVKAATFSDRLKETLAYWRKTLSEGMQLHVPDEEFNRFYRAELQHILVSIQRDVKTGLDMCPCGTYDYNMFANETLMEARLLDMRGLHDQAWRCIRPIVELQGSHPFPGRFKDGSAIFHGVKVDADHDYTHSGYNLNHGWTLWTASEHYLYTRDRGWLESVLPHLRKGAEWIIAERKTTMQTGVDGQPVPEYGLLPPGQLEDNEEWHYWYAVNAYAYRGLNAFSQVMEEIDPAEGVHLRREAAAYREDIRRAVMRSMAVSPAVPLRDGTFVPHVPPRTPLHGREYGWIRNILYGPLALVDCGVFAPEEEITGWILADYEDNLFMSEESFGVPDRDWFSRGGITLQPNLVNTPVVYLERDQIPQALRAFYNTFAASYYHDVLAFTEWVPTFGIGGGPFFKTSDEAGFLAWLRLFLIRESGDRLFLNAGAPREWFKAGRAIEISHAATLFGETSLRVESHLEAGFITATVLPPTRRQPKEIWLRLRHPEGKRIARVEINGASWSQFNPEKELISLPPGEDKVELKAYY
ncbi:MAG: hypothetical protein ACE145_16665 [Terriglobia bacterium]